MSRVWSPPSRAPETVSSNPCSVHAGQPINLSAIWSFTLRRGHSEDPDQICQSLLRLPPFTDNHDLDILHREMSSQIINPVWVFKSSSPSTTSSFHKWTFILFQLKKIWGKEMVFSFFNEASFFFSPKGGGRKDTLYPHPISSPTPLKKQKSHF